MASVSARMGKRAPRAQLLEHGGDGGRQRRRRQRRRTRLRRHFVHARAGGRALGRWDVGERGEKVGRLRARGERCRELGALPLRARERLSEPALGGRGVHRLVLAGAKGVGRAAKPAAERAAAELIHVVVAIVRWADLVKLRA